MTDRVTLLSCFRKRLLYALPFVLFCSGEFAIPLPAQVTFDWAYVGNSGNGADPITNWGHVPYNYLISTTEVTNAQYVEFLNAVDPTGANDRELYSPAMGSIHGGIENTGATDGARYVTKPGREHNPINFVSFFDAMRFVNWLHNGQGAGDTETGVYAITDGVSETRSTDAKYWIPTIDEWGKAAYHNARAGTAGDYFAYATGSNSIPVSDQPGDNAAGVNYFNDDGIDNGFNDGYALSGLTEFPADTNPLSDVGAYTSALSPYGVFDLNGNVLEWVETHSSPETRYLPGGSWQQPSALLRLGAVNAYLPISEFSTSGIRVAAAVPEPSTIVITALMCASGFLRRTWRVVTSVGT